MKHVRPFSLLVKPTSADCNLRCDYCFYLEKSRLYPESKRHRMSEAVLRRTIRTYMTTEQPVYAFNWQGGEPTLMGADFFRQITRFQQEYGRAGSAVSNGLQTNATLIDEELAEHLGRYRFLVGCSLDGLAEIHDRYRRTRGGRPSHQGVIRGVEVLKRHNVEFNVLVLVSQANVHRAGEVYRYLTEEGFRHHQYVPCVEFDEEGALQPFAINGEQWGAFLCELFDQWYHSDRFRVSIRHIESILLKIVDGQSDLCTMGRDCCRYFVVEHNGDIYPCDFFVQPELRLGNVLETSWSDALTSETYRNFGAQKCRWSETCTTCDCLDLCNGDCLKYRVWGGNPPQNTSWLCTGWRAFLGHTRERLHQLAEEVQRRRIDERRFPVAEPISRDRQRTSVRRNEPCPCGSGLKFKKCCGKSAQTPT
jgi:uncharacterized protein